MTAVTFRHLAPLSAAQQALVHPNSGKAYAATPVTVIDVSDADSAFLASNGWTRIALSGTTAQRPSTNPNVNPPYAASAGLHYVDTTLNAVIVFDGQTWRSPITGAAV